MSDSPAIEFIHQSIVYLNENTPRIKKCLDKLSDEEIWNRPNDSTNSIANLMLHLNGNITQWILSSLGNEPDHRERDKEFSTTGGFTKEELFQKLSQTVAKATDVISKLTEEELLKVRTVQGFQHTGIAIIVHVTEHYSYHTGQIALITKLMKNRDLGFYANVDLNRKNI